jgi:hypothetical protein
VQSAMMKRSDSVNKRWSTQAPVGLSRGNSIASNRSGYGGSMNTPLGSTSPPRDTRPLSMGRESSPRSNSRPISSHSNTTVVANFKENERPGTSGTVSSRAESTMSEGFVKPPLPLNPSRSNRTPDANSPNSPEKDEALPVSPTKTMDSKRWSPTKSSWLESAINKPSDSPKPKPQPSPQPSWMTELNKSKQQKGPTEPVKTGSFKEVTTGGLLRSPPLGGPMKPLTIGGLPEAFSSGLATKNSTGSPTRSTAASTPADSQDKKDLMDETPTKAESLTKMVREQSQTPPTNTGKFDQQPPKTNPFASVLTPRHDRSSPTPELKPKPETPPKKDFRANLKPRQLPKEESANQEPEFKNALGKLKRTQTKNYVAPDELKGNILRGKAGLNTTGGPKKNERVDELKESILKQKEAMKTGGGTLRRQPTGEIISKEKTLPPVPEALAKRKNFTRSNSNLSDGATKEQTSFKSGAVREDEVSSSDGSPLSKIENKSKPAVGPKFSPKPSTPAFERRPFQAAPGPKDVKDSSKPSLESSTLGNFGTATTAQPTRTEPVVTAEPLRDTSKPAESVPPNAPATAPMKESTGGKLAGRLNPALASILSRGPPASSESSTSEPIAKRDDLTSQSSDQSPNSVSGKNLTHMTKGRAKGPKRRLPTAQASDPGSSSPSATPAVEETKKPEQLTTKSSEKLGTQSSISPKSSTPRPVAANKNEDSELADLYPPKPPTLRPLGGLTSRPNHADSQFADLYPPQNASLKKRSVFDSDSTSPGKMSPSLDKSRPAVSSKSPPLQRVVSPSSKPFPPPEPREVPGAALTALIQQKLEEDPEGNDPIFHSDPPFLSPPRSASGRSAPKYTPKQDPSSVAADDVQSKEVTTIGLGLRSVSINSRGKEPLDRNVSTPPTKTPKSPPIPKKSSGISLNSSPSDQFGVPPASRKSGTATTTKITHRIKPSITSPIPRTSDAQRVILDFFNETPNHKDKLDFETQGALSSKSDVLPTIKSIKRTTWEINGDGKRQNMPPGQEYILFEECMYLVVHNYITEENGVKSNDVTLWCGDGVSEAAIEDAQLFCRKVARENNTKLVVLKQGRETASFIHGIGGILVTRRKKASSLYMLCCRQHLGQIVFDEVDLSPNKLCSAFPYIISAKFGKLYLWKGKGAAADELGCARLIAMGA